MNKLQSVVGSVLEKQKQLLAPSTFDIRRRYLECLVSHAAETGIVDPCQELYDSYVARATTPDLRFQLFHAVRLVDKEAGTKAFTPEGNLYNEPELPSSDEMRQAFQGRPFPVIDGSIDIGCLIRRAESEMEYLQLTESTKGQYMKAWRELYISFYLRGDTAFTRINCKAFSEDAAKKHKDGTLHNWKYKIRRRAVDILLEVADTGSFKWKLFPSRKVC